MRIYLIKKDNSLINTPYEGWRAVICRLLERTPDGKATEEFYAFNSEDAIRILRSSQEKMVYSELTGTYNNRLVPFKEIREGASICNLSDLFVDLTNSRLR